MSLKAKLREKKPNFGTWITIAHPEVVEIASTVPFDWLMFDMEHSPLDIQTLEIMLPGLNGSEITPLVRVPWNDFVTIKRVLDLGFDGILVPWVNSKEEAKKVVEACQYPPVGIRGTGPRRCIRYGAKDILEYYNKFEKERLVIAIQVETQKSLDNLTEILSVEGIDVAFIGPNDLSASLGIFRQFNHPKFTEALKKVVRACEETGKVAGIMTSGSEDAKKRLEEGFKFIALAHDFSNLRRAFQNELNSVKSFLEKGK